MRRAMEAALARHTGQSPNRIRSDVERDLFLTAEQAVDYGLADQIVPSRKKS